MFGMNEAEFWVRFCLAVLASWRVTHLLASEDGPWDVIVKIREWLGQSILGKLMDCFYCLSLWIAAPAALFVTRDWLEWIMVWLAISGGACLAERVGGDAVVMEPVSEFAEGDDRHVLRSEAVGVEE